MPPRLQQKTALKARLSLQARESLALLRAHGLELKTRVEKALASHPALERSEVPSSPSVYPLDQIPYTPTWSEQIHKQLAFLPLQAQERPWALELLNDLNSRGFLNESLETKAKDMGLPLKKLEKVQAKFRELDPPGLGARDLAEALLWQLEAKNQTGSLAYALLKQVPRQLLKGDVEAASKILKVSSSKIKESLKILSQLHFAPLEKLETDSITTPPDLIFFFQQNKWQVQLADRYTASLRIRSDWATHLKNPVLNKQEKSLLASQLKQAHTFLENLNRREQTLEAIGKLIIAHQSRALEQGFTHLKAHLAEEAARTLKLHPSTLSRALRHKIAQTPQGSLPLKQFFTPTLTTQTKNPAPQSPSKVAIKYQIAQFIAQENAQAPLSDRAISQHFQEKKGLPLSTRTVHNYRQSLRIPSSRKRKLNALARLRFRP